MNITVGEIIGNFIFIAGSFLLLVFLIKKFAKETAEKNKAGILANAAEEAGRLKAKANQEIAQNKAEAMSSIKGEVADLTVTLASKILSQELDKEAQSELIDRYIKQLGDA